MVLAYALAVAVGIAVICSTGPVLTVGVSIAVTCPIGFMVLILAVNFIQHSIYIPFTSKKFVKS